MELKLNYKQAEVLQKGTDYYRKVLLQQAKETRCHESQRILMEDFTIINRIDLDIGILLRGGSVLFDKEEVKYAPKQTESTLYEDHDELHHDARLDVFG